MTKKMALGRGLDSLLSVDPISTNGSSYINEIELDLIIPNPNQPRTFFDEEALGDLSESIKQIGIITPITIKKNADNTYQIIAGERRYRAARMAGLKKIPAYIKTSDDEQVLEMALVENIQREDLNSIEIALAYQNLLETLNVTQEELSSRVGKKRATVTNYLRLLKLPAEVQMGIKDKKIDMGHARALISLENPIELIELYEETVKNNYSVRKIEERVREITKHPQQKLISKASKEIPEKYKSYSDTVTRLLGEKVFFSCNERGKGKITFTFSSESELSDFIKQIDR